MKIYRRKNLLILLLIFSLVLISGCSQSSQEKNFETYIPPESGEIGEEINLDEKSLITINDVWIEDNSEGNQVLMIQYDWENISNGALIGIDSYLFTANQDGVKLEASLELIENEKLLVTELPANETIENIEQGYILGNQEDITLSLDGSIDIVIIDAKPQSANTTSIDISYDDIEKR